MEQTKALLDTFSVLDDSKDGCYANIKLLERNILADKTLHSMAVPSK
jgi:hypothetical protein